MASWLAREEDDKDKRNTDWYSVFKISLYMKGKETWFKLQILLLLIWKIPVTECAAKQLSTQGLISKPPHHCPHPNPGITLQGICFVFAMLTL